MKRFPIFFKDRMHKIECLRTPIGAYASFKHLLLSFHMHPQWSNQPTLMKALLTLNPSKPITNPLLDMFPSYADIWEREWSKPYLCRKDWNSKITANLLLCNIVKYAGKTSAMDDPRTRHLTKGEPGHHPRTLDLMSL